MRLRAIPFFAMALLACDGSSSLQEHRLPPPTVSVSASTLVLHPAGSPPALRVSALVRNETSEPLQVAVGPACPLFVRVFPDSTGEYQASVDASMACATGTPTLLLAPGDSTVLTRLLTAADLALYGPGTYGVNVVVTTSTAIIGVWGGAIALPL
jgi:hypothetical protein